MANPKLQQLLENKLFENTAGVNVSTLKRMLNSLPLVFAFWFLNKVICWWLFWMTVHGRTTLFDSLYWSETTSSTTGYGDVLPNNVASKVVAMWYMESNFWLTLMLGALFVVFLIVNKSEFSDAEQEEVKDDLNDIDGKTEWCVAATKHMIDELVRSGLIAPMPEHLQNSYLQHMDTHSGS